MNTSPPRSMRIEKFLEISPFFAIQECFQLLSRHIQAQFKKEELSLLQGLILISLLFDRDEEVSPGLLVNVFKTSKSNVGQALTHLENKKMIKRKLSGNDARSFHLVLTKEGMKCANTLSRILDHLQTRWEKSLGEGKLKDLRTLLKEIGQGSLETPKGKNLESVDSPRA